MSDNYISCRIKMDLVSPIIISSSVCSRDVCPNNPYDRGGENWKYLASNLHHTSTQTVRMELPKTRGGTLFGRGRGYIWS